MVSEDLAKYIMTFIVSPKKKLSDRWNDNEEWKKEIMNKHSQWEKILENCCDTIFLEQVIYDMNQYPPYLPVNIYRVCRNKYADKIIKRIFKENIQEEENGEEKKRLEITFYCNLSYNESKFAFDLMKEEIKRRYDKENKSYLEEFLEKIDVQTFLENKFIDEETIRILNSVGWADFYILSSNDSLASVNFVLGNTDDYTWLSKNESPKVVEYLLRPGNKDRIFNYHFSSNYYATDYYLENPDKIVISGFLLNKNPKAIEFIRNNLEMFGLPHTDNIFMLLHNGSKEAFDLFDELVFGRCNSPSMISHKNILKRNKSLSFNNNMGNSANNNLIYQIALNNNEHAWMLLKENPCYVSLEGVVENKNFSKILYEPDEVATHKYINEYLFG
jgi:hypothetical protein